MLVAVCMMPTKGFCRTAWNRHCECCSKKASQAYCTRKCHSHKLIQTIRFFWLMLGQYSMSWQYLLALIGPSVERSLEPEPDWSMTWSKDMKHAGNILIASLGRQPENTLLHWAGEILQSTLIRQLGFESIEVWGARFVLSRCLLKCWFDFLNVYNI